MRPWTSSRWSACSGAGKSSFVLAGVIPRLQEQERWLAMRMRPGRHPLRALAALLMARGNAETAQRITARFESGPSVSLDTSSIPDLASPGAALAAAERELGEELAEHPTRLALKLLKLAEAQQTRVLLFVDQLEEVFTLGLDRATRRTFLDAVCRAAPAAVRRASAVAAAGRERQDAAAGRVRGHGWGRRRPRPPRRWHSRGTRGGPGVGGAVAAVAAGDPPRHPPDPPAGRAA
ncbi:MAG: hypothetical protein QGH45_01245, partial [Myxococcota bacterium]|nr:hypothetical protein [Myxococcota bacterium]